MDTTTTYWAIISANQLDLLTDRRLMAEFYLDIREAVEEADRINREVAAAYRAAREALVEVLVADGDYADRASARMAVHVLHGGVAEHFVARWLHLEGLSTHLGSGEIASIAESVRAWVADGTRLADLDMWKLADPYLTGGGL